VTSETGLVPDPIRHGYVEDGLGLATGVVLASLGLVMLHHVHAVTGGTAGLSLLVAYWSGLPFQVLFIAINLPFFALALWKKGVSFTLRSLACVIAASVLSSVQAHLIHLGDVNRLYGVLIGNLLAGVGLLILFRHGSSLGGFNIFALLMQERLGLRAGYVQMGMDICVVLVAFAVVTPTEVLLSALGAVVLNVVLALNHRPGRYLGY
jgi:uncharacterized membrane-anchored protein YitT (DUF2179 family)